MRQRIEIRRTKFNLESVGLMMLLLVVPSLLLLSHRVCGELEVAANETAVSFKNDDFLSRQTVPDIQAVLQKQLNDKKFENLNMFLVIIKNSLAEAGYQIDAGKLINQPVLIELPFRLCKYI